eukprot:5982995-Amphidinium_carterae.2
MAEDNQTQLWPTAVVQCRTPREEVLRLDNSLGLFARLGSHVDPLMLAVLKLWSDLLLAVPVRAQKGCGK